MSQETPNWDNSRRIMLKVPSSPLPSRPRTYIESNTQQSEKLEEAEAPSAPSAPSTPHWDDIDGTDGADGAVGKDGAVGADGASQWSDTLSARTDEKKIGYTVVIISLRVCTWVYMLHFNTSFICIFLFNGCNNHVVCVHYWVEAVVLCQIFQKKDAQSDEENLYASML